MHAPAITEYLGSPCNVLAVRLRAGGTTTGIAPPTTTPEATARPLAWRAGELYPPQSSRWPVVAELLLREGTLQPDDERLQATRQPDPRTGDIATAIFYNE